MSEYTRIYQRACDYANRRASDNNESEDWDIIWNAKYFLDRCGVSHFGIEHVYEEGDQSAKYINMGDTYDETIFCEDGKCFVSCLGDWVEEAERKYCEEENKIRCAACGEFSDNTNSGECTWCETHYTNGSEIPTKGSQLTGCTELRNWDTEMLWADDTQVETHASKSRYTTIIVRLQFTEEYDSEWARNHGKYHVEVLAVTPGIVRKHEREQLLNSLGQTQEDWNNWSEHARCEACIDYETYATLWQNTGNDVDALLREAEQQRYQMHTLIGFRLDGPQNAIGTSGWDFMRGSRLGGLKK